MKIKKVERFVGLQIIEYIARFFYFAGLTALIPLTPLLLFPQKLVEAKVAFGIALTLIFIGFFIVYIVSHSKKVALRSLGLMTLIPGLLAVFFIYSGPRRITKLLNMFGEASPFLEKWITTYMPKGWLLASVYIILGCYLIWISYRVKRKFLF